MDNPQVKYRNMIIDYKDKFIKKLKLPGNPLKFNFSNNKKVADPAPDLNENKKEILKLLRD
jgi:crotonobetainyl-CoA:carnitine CoA-transferase CaiB-like acyl-CoA transferase